jgi:hypothetical protein
MSIEKTAPLSEVEYDEHFLNNFRSGAELKGEGRL